MVKRFKNNETKDSNNRTRVNVKTLITYQLIKILKETKNKGETLNV